PPAQPGNRAGVPVAPTGGHQRHRLIARRAAARLPGRARARAARPSGAQPGRHHGHAGRADNRRAAPGRLEAPDLSPTHLRQARASPAPAHRPWSALMKMTVSVPASAPRANRSIGAILMDSGILSPEDAERILLFQKENGLRFGEAAIRLGLLSEADIQFALSRQFSYAYLRTMGDKKP